MGSSLNSRSWFWDNYTLHNLALKYLRGRFHYFAKVSFVVRIHVTIISPHLYHVICLSLQPGIFYFFYKSGYNFWSFWLLYASLDFCCCFEKPWLDLRLYNLTQLSSHVISSFRTCSSQFPCFLSVSQKTGHIEKVNQIRSQMKPILYTL